MSNGIALLSSEERIRDWLTDIVENADQIAQYLESVDVEIFRTDLMRRDAVERCLERVAEACIRIGPERIETLLPGLDLNQVRGLGNRLRYEYDRINSELIWATATGPIRELRDACAAALRD